MLEDNKISGKKDHSFIDLCFISLLLASKYPDDYYYMMITPFRRVGKLFEIGLNYSAQLTDGEKYKALAYVGDYIKEKIKRCPEVLKIREGFINPHNRDSYPIMFNDNKYNWITQDLIFIADEILAKNKESLSEL
jgi:hypothetical protein